MFPVFMASGICRRIPVRDETRMALPHRLVGAAILLLLAIVLVLVLAVVGLFNSSGPILFFTLGQHDTYTISYWIFEQVYMKSVYEYASAVGLFFTIVGLPIVMIVKWLLDKVGTEIEY